MAVKIDQFKGIAPKIAPELLADGLAQTAHNCKLDSGNIVPYPEPTNIGDTGRAGVEVKAVYPLTNPDTDEKVWMSWEDEVSVATPAFEPVVTEQRFYYTGDGVPKVSTYDLATSSGPPYPADYYELGLPLPEDKVTTVATAYGQRTITSVQRDSGGIVTFKLGSPHELKTGMFAAVKGFTNLSGSYSRTGHVVTVTIANHGLGAGSTVFVRKTSGNTTDGAYSISNITTNTFDYTETESGADTGNLEVDMRSYNTTGTEVIVVDDATVKMFLPGFEQSEYAITVGRLELAGVTYARTYTYTWYTPWGEESVGAEPSEDLIIKEGQVVTVSNLPTAPPTVPAKNFIRGIKLYRTLAGFRETDFYLLRTLWFPQSTARVSRTGSVVTVETLDPHNLLEDDRFKISGLTNSSADITDGIVMDVVDARTFTYASAGVAIADTADTTGVLYHDYAENSDDDAIYWGDVDFDFIDDFNSKKLTDNLVSDEWIAPPEDMQGITVIQNNILAGFVNNKLCMSEPNEPHAWPEAYQKTLDVNIVAIRALSGVGAVILTDRQPYSLTGNDPATMTLQKVDALYPCVSARGAVSMSYGVLYPTNEGLALYSPTRGVSLVTAPVYSNDAWNQALEPDTIVATYYDNNYFAAHSTGSFIYMYEPDTGGSFVTCDYTFTVAYNDAKAGVVYTVPRLLSTGLVQLWDSILGAPQTATWKSKKFITPDYNNLGAARVKADYTDSPDVTFTLWADGVEVYSNPVYNEEIFRLPRGYRADTFEVSVESNTRIRSIHLGETPISLKEV